MLKRSIEIVSVTKSYFSNIFIFLFPKCLVSNNTGKVNLVKANLSLLSLCVSLSPPVFTFKTFCSPYLLFFNFFLILRALLHFMPSMWHFFPFICPSHGSLLFFSLFYLISNRDIYFLADIGCLHNVLINSNVVGYSIQVLCGYFV